MKHLAIAAFEEDKAMIAASRNIERFPGRTMGQSVRRVNAKMRGLTPDGIRRVPWKV
jgi:hypothetical protein